MPPRMVTLEAHWLSHNNKEQFPDIVDLLEEEQYSTSKFVLPKPKH